MIPNTIFPRPEQSPPASRGAALRSAIRVPRAVLGAAGDTPAVGLRLGTDTIRDALRATARLASLGAAGPAADDEAPGAVRAHADDRAPIGDESIVEPDDECDVEPEDPDAPAGTPDEGDDGATAPSQPPRRLAVPLPSSASPPSSPPSSPPASDPSSPPPPGATRPKAALPSARTAAGPGRRTRAASGTRHALLRPGETRGDAVGVGWDWSADPYQRCTPRCASCASREPHAAVTGGNAEVSVAAASGAGDVRRAARTDSSRAPFQDRLCVKSCFPEALRRDLRGLVRAGDHLAFGAAADPYPRAERHECVTRAALRELTRVGGLRISITTRSTLVTRDLDLLVRIAARNAVQVNLTMSTVDPRLARALEPQHPSPAGSLAALREIRAAGISAGVVIGPVIPGVTDAEIDLRAIVLAVRDAGACFVCHRTVFPDAGARTQILAVLRRTYPRMAARHELWARCGPSLPRDVRDQVAARVAAAARGCGLPGPTGEHPPAPVIETQRRFEFAS